MDAVGANGGLVVWVAAEVEEPAVNFGVEGLDAAIEHFRETGVGAQVGDVQASLAQGLGGAAGGNQFHTRGGEGLGQRDESRFIGNRKQRASYLLHNRALPSSRPAREVNRQKPGGYWRSRGAAEPKPTRIEDGGWMMEQRNRKGHSRTH